MNEQQKEALIGNTARNIATCSDTIKYRHAVHCMWADKDYGTRMTKALKLDMRKVDELAKGNHKSLIASTLPGGQFSDKPNDMHSIDEKYWC